MHDLVHEREFQSGGFHGFREANSRISARIIAGKTVSPRVKTSSGAAVEPPVRAPVRSHGCDSLPAFPSASPERQLWR